jgi:hypothetical protein
MANNIASMFAKQEWAFKDIWHFPVWSDLDFCSLKVNPDLHAAILFSSDLCYDLIWLGMPIWIQ